MREYGALNAGSISILSLSFSRKHELPKELRHRMLNECTVHKNALNAEDKDEALSVDMHFFGMISTVFTSSVECSQWLDSLLHFVFHDAVEQFAGVYAMLL